MRGYEVLRKLADGSAAEVYLARDPRSRRNVILEVSRAELASDMELYARFLDEAKDRQKLSHPNLLRHDSTGCAPDGRLFAVTEPLEGEHLGGWILAHGPLSPSEAIAVVLPMCDALEYLHARGVVHGHLRPSSIFVEGAPGVGAAKLFDTGLSLFRSTRSLPTTASLVLVEPEYLAPERIQGRRATALSDIYGLGVLLYELITGRPPFTSPTPEQTRALHLKAQPPKLPPKCARLEPVILRCLAKDPLKRYPTAAAVKQALSWLAGNATPKPTDAPVRPAAPPVPTLNVEALLSEPAYVEDSRELPAVDEPLGTSSAVMSSAEFELIAGGSAAPVTPSMSGDTARTARAGQTDDTPPPVLGNYALDKLLGQGGMGRVYLGKHLKLERKVALKVLKAELSQDPQQLRRFFQEAKAVNKVNHENIVEIYDFVEEPNGRVYCVMELLEGRSLKQLAKKGPLPIARAVRIVRQVAQALEAAHQVGVVHRDIKPDNIYLVQKGNDPDFVKVLDFGIAKLRAATDDGEATKAGVVVGTPAYMAPEQALGDGVDHRADIYSLCTVLYALLAGGPPFDAGGGPLGALMARVVTQPAPPLPPRSAGGEAIPEPLRRLVDRNLSKTPDERVQSMAELARALEPFEKEVAPPPLPTATGRSSPTLPKVPLLRDRPRWLVPATLGLGLIVLLSGVLWLALRPSRQAQGTAASAQVLPADAAPAQADAPAVAAEEPKVKRAPAKKKNRR